MKKITIIILPILLSACVTSYPSVAPQTNTLAPLTSGPGTRSCGSVLGEIRQDRTLVSEAVFRGWALGYMAGLNVHRAMSDLPTVNVSDEQSHAVWLENYCRNNPLNALVAAANALYTELLAQQGYSP